MDFLDFEKIAEDVALTYWGKEGETAFKDEARRVVNYLARWTRGNPECVEWEKMMCSKLFLPNSPVFMNAGTNRESLAACFVLPLLDSMESIFGTLRDSASTFLSLQA
jgi:ribonucleotide reductase alpha subunit